MIRLVTISRISKEKGFERMLHMESLLIAAGIEFVWDCYGDASTYYAKQVISRFKCLIFKGITNNSLEVLKDYDYLVQLSDTEGFSYSIYEAIANLVPVIVTNFPCINEMITDGVNGYILKMDLSNFDIDKIKAIPEIRAFKEKSSEQDWIKFIDKEQMRAKKQPQKPGPKPKEVAKSNTTAPATQAELNKTETGPTTGVAPLTTTAPTPGTKPDEPVKLIAVKVILKYFDTMERKEFRPGQILLVHDERAKVLIEAEVAILND